MTVATPAPFHPTERLRRWRRLAPCAFAALLCVVASVRAEEIAAAASLAGASLEELMNVRVTTVSREESTVGESPAAVFVITPEMIARSGATSIPEALRMVPGLQVASVDS